MPILGAHMSIAGGYYRAVELAASCGCDCVQLFTKNNNQWRAKPVSHDDAARFARALADCGIVHPLAHDSYLINLAAPDDDLWVKSLQSLRDELLRAEKLGIGYLVTHPGAYTVSDEATGIRRIVKALDEIHRQTQGISARILLENTAGQGTCLGWKLDHLAHIIVGVESPERLGVCIDTCHLFAAGYDLHTAEQYGETMAQLEAAVGLARVKAFHVNDSKQPCGSRVDRHAHIGRGHLGLEPFRHLLNDPRWQATPMYLETPKEKENGEEMDVVNLRVLRSLIAG